MIKKILYIKLILFFMSSCGDDVSRGVLCSGINNSLNEFNRIILYNTFPADIRSSYGAPDEYRVIQTSTNLLETMIYYGITGSLIPGCQSYLFKFQDGELIEKRLI